MKRFEFSLQVVLQQRLDSKQTAAQQVAIAVAEVERIQSAMAELQNALPASERSTPGKLVSASALSRASRVRRDLQQRLRTLQTDLETAQRELNDRRDELTAADREVLMLEKLRDQQLREFNRQAKRAAETQRLEDLCK